MMDHDAPGMELSGHGPQWALALSARPDPGLGHMRGPGGAPRRRHFARGGPLALEPAWGRRSSFRVVPTPFKLPGLRVTVSGTLSEVGANPGRSQPAPGPGRLAPLLSRVRAFMDIFSVNFGSSHSVRRLFL